MKSTMTVPNSGTAPAQSESAQPHQEASVPHVHIDEKGIAHKCYHECKSMVRDYRFWIGVTISFPIEHALWGFIYDLLGWSH